MTVAETTKLEAEIERLYEWRKGVVDLLCDKNDEIERLREALQEITRVGSVDRACNIARRALEHKP